MGDVPNKNPSGVFFKWQVISSSEFLQQLSRCSGDANGFARMLLRSLSLVLLQFSRGRSRALVTSGFGTCYRVLILELSKIRYSNIQ